VLSALLCPDGDAEPLVIDAETGIPLRFVGGVPGTAPGIGVTL
jgi:hypothetical protein